MYLVGNVLNALVNVGAGNVCIFFRLSVSLRTFTIKLRKTIDTVFNNVVCNNTGKNIALINVATSEVRVNADSSKFK